MVLAGAYEVLYRIPNPFLQWELELIAWNKFLYIWDSFFAIGRLDEGGTLELLKLEGVISGIFIAGEPPALPVAVAVFSKFLLIISLPSAAEFSSV